jgi:hypothetical protein
MGQVFGRVQGFAEDPIQGFFQENGFRREGWQRSNDFQYVFRALDVKKRLHETSIDKGFNPAGVFALTGRPLLCKN